MYMVGSRERTTRHSPINAGDGAIEQSLLEKLVELDRSTNAALEQVYGGGNPMRYVLGALGITSTSAIPMAPSLKPPGNLSATASLAGEPSSQSPPPLDDLQGASQASASGAPLRPPSESGDPYDA